MSIQISLAAARKNAGLSQKDVANALNINQTTLVKWEKHETEPKVSQARRLADMYKIPLANIFFG
jgi:DNA-binding XRE family transcriptional regulator